MGRRRTCTEFIGELTIDNMGDDLENFIELVEGIQNDLGKTYKKLRIYADNTKNGYFKLYGIRYMTDDEVSVAKAKEAEKSETRKRRMSKLAA